MIRCHSHVHDGSSFTDHPPNESGAVQLDTSFFINGWWKHYGMKVFPAVWDELDILMFDGRVFSCQEVYGELEEQRDSLFEWAKRRKDFFLTPTSRVLSEVKRIMARFPNFAATAGTKNGADPWVIAQAIASNATVVTYEVRATVEKKSRPTKIPNACKEFSIRCLTPMEFLGDADLKFVRPDPDDCA